MRRRVLFWDADVPIRAGWLADLLPAAGQRGFGSRYPAFGCGWLNETNLLMTALPTSPVAPAMMTHAFVLLLIVFFLIENKCLRYCS